MAPGDPGQALAHLTSVGRRGRESGEVALHPAHAAAVHVKEPVAAGLDNEQKENDQHENSRTPWREAGSTATGIASLPLP